MYHRIADEDFDPWGLAVSPANFTDQIDWLSQNRTLLPLDEFVTLNRAGALPRNAVAVTFDDGYACNAAATKALTDRDIPETIFLPLDLVASGGEFWWDELQQIVMAHEDGALSLDSWEIPVGERDRRDGIWPPETPPATARQKAYHRLWALLYAMTPGKLADGMEQLRRQVCAPQPRDTHRPMSLDEVRASKSLLTAFGSHALTHPSLPMLDEQAKRTEITASVERFEELIGEKPRAFAYPYGNSDPESERLVEEAGFICGCLAGGWFVRQKTNPFALPRIFVGNWNSQRLARQLGRPKSSRLNLAQGV